MSNVQKCVNHHLGDGKTPSKSPIAPYRAAMVGDANEAISKGMSEADAWARVITRKLKRLQAEHKRITGLVSAAYAETPEGMEERGPDVPPAPQVAAPAPAEPAAPVASKTVATAKAPKPSKAPSSVAGSEVLGAISNRLGGLSTKLLADLSEKVTRTRTTKLGKTTSYTTWKNPLHSRVGLLFRSGGTSDMSEVARVLEEEGFLAPNSLEQDALGATQEAERIVRAELQQGGQAIRIGDAQAVDDEMQARRDAYMDGTPDVFFGLDELDLESAGYESASPETKARAEQWLAAAEALGLDTEALREDAARGIEDQSEEFYYARLEAYAKDAVTKANGGAPQADASAAGGGNADRGQATGDQGEEVPLELTSPTRAQVLKQQDALAQEAADKEGGTAPASRLTGDQVDIFNPQGSVFDSYEAIAFDVAEDEARRAKAEADAGAAIRDAGPNDGSVANEARRRYSVEPTFKDDRNLGARAAGDVTVSTRTPTAIGATENTMRDRLGVGIGVVAADPTLTTKHAEIIRSDATVRLPDGASDAQAIDAFIEHLKSNLVWLYNSVPANIRARSRNWYKGANRIANKLAKLASISEQAASGVLAALSPQTPWDVNVSQAGRVIFIWKNHQNTRADKAMNDWFLSKEAALRADGLPIETLAALRMATAGKTLAEISDLGQKAWWVRAFDETHHDRSYWLVAPEGEAADLMRNKPKKPGMEGAPSNMPWGNAGNIAKALSILDNGSLANISEQLGVEHKVRSFYNNIVSPDNQDGHVTIDTHAVAAARLEPLSGSSPEVAQAWGGKGSSAVFGQGGLYGEYAEAYRRAAAEVGVLPREMQSITWEAVRGLFPADFKTRDANVAIKAIWRRYHQGAVPLRVARNQIVRFAGGVDAPNWNGSAQRGDSVAVAQEDGPGGDAGQPAGGQRRGREVDAQPGLFGESVSPATRGGRSAATRSTAKAGNAQPQPALSADTPAPAGDYYVRTTVGVTSTRQLGSASIKTAADAAAATSYLYRSAVERFDGIVTDKNGKPLAVVGGFKGALSQTSVYPSTLVGEAVRIPGAAQIWFSHNHPSGSSVLSRADGYLNTVLSDAFRGSGIEPMGLLAVGNGKFSFAPPGQEMPSISEAPIQSRLGTSSVPAIEREIASNTPQPTITGPEMAIDAAQEHYDAAGNAPGIILLNSQYGVIGWVPLGPEMLGKLRNTGGLKAIYRAVSESNAGAALLVHGGELDARPFSESSVTIGANIGAALKKIDVNPLDIINAKTALSNAQQGLSLQSGPVFSRSYGVGKPGQSTDVNKIVSAIRARWDNAPETVVVSDINDPAVPDVIRKENDSQLSRGATGAPEGVYYGGKVYLFSSQLKSDADVVRVLFHEALGHAGLRGTYGKELGTILDRLSILNQAQVREKAKQYGFDYDKPSQRRAATEELLAEMAQTRPEIGWVKRAIAAIRSFLRKNVPGFAKMRMSDAEIISNFILPARAFVEQPGFDITPAMREKAAGGLPMFSRSPAEVLRGINQQTVRNAFLDATTKNGNVSLWAKTVGTQYDLAQRNPETFGRVFNSVQDYIKDISSLANSAADLAPSILPKLDNFTDLVRKPTPKADLDAAGAVIFQGTLDKQLFTREELLAKGLTEKQADLYEEFRAAVNQSLEDTAKTEIVNLGGKDGEPVRAQVLAAQTASEAADIMAAHLEALGQNDAAEMIKDKASMVDKLKEEAYAPLMRFGEYTLLVQGKDGETLFFSMYESEREANAMARKLKADPEFKDAEFTQGTMSQEQHKLFKGISVESLELFGHVIGQEGNQVFQDFLKFTKNNRSALKRLIKREGIAGFSEDTERVLASFITSNSRLASGNLHLGRAKEAVSTIPNAKGQLKDQASKLVEYVQNPQEEAAQIRGLLFATFIGGSVASAMVNMTQPFTMTLPYLSQFGGALKAGKRMKDALKIVASGKATGEIGDALKRAEKGGIVSPQEIHHLQGAAMGQLNNNPYIRKAAFIWGSMFSLAEQFNRRLSFISAYQTALEEGIADPYAFAEKTVIETQGMYNKGNKANFARGAIGASAMTFKQYSTHYLEWLTRMATAGEPGSAERKAGQKAVAIALGILLLTAGAGGLPFADDLDDLIDTLAQAMGYDFNSKTAKRKFISETLGLGETAAEIGTRGLTAIPGFPMDLSLRMGMGNLLPATGMFLRSNTDRSRDLLEVAGAAGSLIKMGMDGGQKLLQGKPLDAAKAVVPVAIQNMIKGATIWETGEYRDTKGAKVTDADAVDGAMKFIGFQPSEIARESARTNSMYRTVQLAKNVEGEIATKMAQARVDGDVEAEKAAREELADWNRKNPLTPIRIRPQDIVRRVRQLKASRADRFVQSTPKELRPMVRESLN